MSTPERRVAVPPIAFGEVALRLAPRSLGRAVDAPRVALHGHRQTASERNDLERAPLTIERRTWTGDASGEDWIVSGARAAWLETASAVVQVIFDAHERAHAPRRPVQTMGIVNVTPDSFSDGGRYLDPERAIEHGLALEAEGATILDIGGESSRPGAEPVGTEVELERVVPVVRGLAGRTRAAISVDTTKAAVARACLDAGATIVNDISAGRFDDAMLALVAERRCGFVAMHMQGTPRDMQRAPRYRDPTSEVLEFLRERVAACIASGIEAERVWIDPGIGFGKTLEHNLDLMRRLHELRSLGSPICLGVSRKSFLARLSAAVPGREPTTDPDRRGATAAAIACGVLAGVEIVRVHDVATMVDAVAVASALIDR